MGYINVKCDPEDRAYPKNYIVNFKPSYFMSEVTNFSSSFEGCLDYVTEKLKTEFSSNERFSLKLEGRMPKHQRRILERIVSLRNGAPKAHRTQLKI